MNVMNFLTCWLWFGIRPVATLDVQFMDRASSPGQTIVASTEPYVVSHAFERDSATNSTDS
jgi:hypothetical protein